MILCSLPQISSNGQVITEDHELSLTALVVVDLSGHFWFWGFNFIIACKVALVFCNLACHFLSQFAAF